MKKDVKISVDSGYSVYGKFNGSFDKPLIIILHGLCCSIQEGIYEEAAEWFSKHGYAVYRFNLYGWQNDARQLMDCTLQTHADDLDVVTEYFRKKGVKKIFVVGHSFGGTTILVSEKQKFHAAVLWDPSYKISFKDKKDGPYYGKFIKSMNGYLMRWGQNVILGKKMIDEVDSLNWDNLTNDFHCPIKIIAARKGTLIKGAKQYFREAHEPKSMTVIDGATHYFDDSKKIRIELFQTTKQWFDKY